MPDSLCPSSSAQAIGHGTERYSPQGRHAVHEGNAGTQLLFLPGSETTGPVAAVIPLDPDTLGRVEALIRFWRACHRRPIPPDTRMTIQQRRRLRLMLQTADGREHGASYRDIATAFYGPVRVATDPWKTSSIRDTVIGLARDGAAMIGGDYLKLLRHRRRV